MQGKTVLIIHSEEMLTDLLAQNLQEVGLQVVRAPNLSQAAKTFMFLEPDLVMAELGPLSRASPDARSMLMGGDGKKPIPVLALSTVADAEISVEGLSGVVRVPFKSGELIALVRRHLESDVEHSLAGELSRVAVTDLLTMFDMGKRSGQIKLDDGQRQAWLDMRSGEVVGGGIGDTSHGAEIIDELIDWQRGSFEVTFMDASEVEVAANPSSSESRATLGTRIANDPTSTKEISLESEERDYLKKLLDDRVGSSDAESGAADPAVSRPEADSGREVSPAADSQPTQGGQAVHHALTLLNTVAAYASGFAEKQLMQRKLEGVRQRLVKTHGGLSVFEVFPDATVGLRSEFDPAAMNSQSIVEATAEWLIALTLDLDRTFPGSMPRATLRVLVESIGDGPEEFGFLEAMGFGGGADPWS
ncbi:MAG: DUF4388 domain-containing protein [Acidobacteriota bacterium]